ncbi:hypothetical protein Y032_0033g2710 [Ancylostoma ceylanicum]|uniref:Uncharacterized protein n=1 Tax=Ancylostoma ceylanicum TaxID=53326 RepID=A0A016UME8_9BILA|nr:hypothetical protein Y032_0033g2710 [Ancylostoma ceylanicum]
MGKMLEDVNMRESSDEDEEVQHVNPVSQSESTFPDMTITAELGEIVDVLREVPEAISRGMADHKISSRYKEKHFENLKREIDVVCSKVERLKANCQLTRVLHGKLFKVLSERGIESEEDWAQYVRTLERDGDMLAELCDILNTDMLQIVDVVKDTKARAESCDAGRNGNVAEEPALGKTYKTAMSSETAMNVRKLQMQSKMEPIGRYCEQGWRPCVETSWENPREATGQSIGFEMINCFQSLSCMDPGVFKGKPNENFNEFVRRFRRKYQRVVLSDQVLVEILGDDHLGGRAKSVFSFLFSHF